MGFMNKKGRNERFNSAPLQGDASLKLGVVIINAVFDIVFRLFMDFFQFELP